MRRPYVKIVLFLLLVIFCIFFGVDIANRGMERIQGPTMPAGTASGPVKTAASRYQPAAAVKPASESANAAAAKPSVPQPARSEQDEAMNYVGNKAGNLLQIAAHHMIQAVVSLFGSLIG